MIAIDDDAISARVQVKKAGSDDVFSVKGRYLVGADGGNSLTRRCIGDERIDLNYSRQWIVMDMIVHDRAVWEAIREGAEFKCDADAAVVFVKGHHGHIRLDCEVTADIAATFNEADARRMAEEYFDASSAEFIRIAPYHFYAGMPKQWRAGRLLLAGDAAHQTSPFAGQGLNMGLRDAANLAFKFDLIFKGKADDRLLDSYAQERWENCKSIILAATANGRILSISQNGGFSSAIWVFDCQFHAVFGARYRRGDLLSGLSAGADWHIRPCRKKTAATARDAIRGKALTR